ncbi:MAG TPA: thioredoxin domain-containing protein [Chryseosolibacter sp.]
MANPAKRPLFRWPYRFLLVMATGILTFTCSQKNDHSLAAASIDGETISLSELDATIQSQLYESLFGVYYMRRIALEELLAEKLLAKEAKARGLTKEQLVAEETRIQNTEQGLQNFIKEKRIEEGIPDKQNPLRLIPLTSPEGKTAVMEAYQKDILIKLVNTLKTKYKAESFLVAPTPPRLNVSRLHGYARGSDAPLVEVWVVSDFTCSECQKHFNLFQGLFERYKSTVKFHFTPLSIKPTLASVVCECAGAEGKFWEMHDLIFTKKPQDTADFQRLAQQIDLDEKRLAECLDNSGSIQDKIAKNIRELDALTINITPSVIIDGRLYLGEFSFEKISDHLDELLEKKSKKNL